MHIPPQHIGFDIDGVVADTMEAFIRLAAEDHGITSIRPDDITCYMVEECLDLDPQIIESIFARLLNDPLETGLKPMAGCIPVLQELATAGPLTFITARPAELPIARWLKHLLGDDIFANCCLIAMGEHDGKAEYIRKRGLQYFVDDRLQTCFLLEQQDITPIVFNQPWNDFGHGFQSVNNWDDIRQLCMTGFWEPVNA